LPRLVREVKPLFTAEARRRKIQGSVILECVVEADGTVGQVRTLRSLESAFGLDQEAVKAAKQWRFSPGERNDVPVPVAVTIELTFNPEGASFARSVESVLLWPVAAVIAAASAVKGVLEELTSIRGLLFLIVVLLFMIVQHLARIAGRR
jgi:TonB family protein